MMRVMAMAVLLVLLSMAVAVTPNYSEEAAAVKGVMEAARLPADAAARGVEAQAPKAGSAGTASYPVQFPNLDADLMGNADRVQREMKEMSSAAASAPVKRTA